MYPGRGRAHSTPQGGDLATSYPGHWRAPTLHGTNRRCCMPPARLIYFRQSVSVACVACASSVWRASLQNSFFADGRTASAEFRLQLQMQIGPHPQIHAVWDASSAQITYYPQPAFSNLRRAGLPRHITCVYEKDDATLVRRRCDGWTEHRRSDHFGSTRGGGRG